MHNQADPDRLDLYEPISRSLKIDGYSTSVRLERIFWNVLDEMAAERGVTTGGLVADLHRDVFARHDRLRNFASVLRVLCATHLAERVRPVMPPAAAQALKAARS